MQIKIGDRIELIKGMTSRAAVAKSV